MSTPCSASRTTRPRWSWMIAQASRFRSISSGVSRDSPSSRCQGPGVAPEAVIEQQDEMVVVGAEHAVVKGLPVVGVGTRLQQQPGEGDGVGVPGLAAFAVAEHAGEHGERGGQGMPEPAVVGVGTGGK